MTSRTGNRGFTLIEVMVATVILSLGAVMVYQAFFIAADSYNYCLDYLGIAAWMDDKIFEVQEALSRFGALGGITTSGVLTSRNREFSWDILQELIGQPPDLYRLRLTVTWQEGRRKVNLSREAYALHLTQE